MIPNPKGNQIKALSRSPTKPPKVIAAVMSLVLPPTLHLGAAGAGDDNRVGSRDHAVAAAAGVVGPALERLLLQSQGTALNLQLGCRCSAAAALFFRFRLVTHFCGRSRLR